MLPSLRAQQNNHKNMMQSPRRVGQTSNAQHWRTLVPTAQYPSTSQPVDSLGNGPRELSLDGKEYQAEVFFPPTLTQKREHFCYR